MMGGHTKSSSHEHNMFGPLCRAYRCFISRCHRDKKHSPSNKQKSITGPRSTDRLKSYNETSKELNDKNEARRSTNDMIQGLRSHKANEVHPQVDIPNSPSHNSNNQNHKSKPLSRKSGLFRSASQMVRTPTQTQTQTQSRLTRSLTRQSVDTREPDNVGQLKKSSSSHNHETMGLGRSGSMAYSGPLFRSPSRKGAPDIVYSNMNGLVKLLTIEQNLECTLEDLCFGCVKKITIARNAIASNGKIIKETETLSIKVKPGWTKGTKITFEGTKNEEKGTHSCDVNFVITDKKHTLYRREGDDLELAVRISLVQALTSCTLRIPLLGGDKMSLTLDEIIVHGYEKMITGQGMPKSKEKGQRGNLKLTFLVDFPTELTEDQRSEIVTILQDSF